MTNSEMVTEIASKVEDLCDTETVLASDLMVAGISKSDMLISFDLLTLKLERLALWMRNKRKDIK